MPLKTLPHFSIIKGYFWFINDNPAPSFLEKGNQRTLPHFSITKSTNLPVSPLLFSTSSMDELSLQCSYSSTYLLINFFSPHLWLPECPISLKCHCFSSSYYVSLSTQTIIHIPALPFSDPPPTPIFLSTTPSSLCLFFKGSITLTHLWGLGGGNNNTNDRTYMEVRGQPTGVSSLLPHEYPRDQFRFSDLKTSNSTHRAAILATPLCVSL